MQEIINHTSNIKQWTKQLRPETVEGIEREIQAIIDDEALKGCINNCF